MVVVGFQPATHMTQEFSPLYHHTASSYMSQMSQHFIIYIIQKEETTLKWEKEQKRGGQWELNPLKLEFSPTYHHTAAS